MILGLWFLLWTTVFYGIIIVIFYKRTQFAENKRIMKKKHQINTNIDINILLFLWVIDACILVVICIFIIIEFETIYVRGTVTKTVYLFLILYAISTTVLIGVYVAKFMANYILYTFRKSEKKKKMYTKYGIISLVLYLLQQSISFFAHHQVYKSFN